MVLLHDGEKVVLEGRELCLEQRMVRGPRPNGSNPTMKRDLNDLVSKAALIAAMVATVKSRNVRRLVKGSIGVALGSFAAFLALMRISKSTSQQFVSKLLPTVMKSLDKALKKAKDELYQGIKGTVLDFGAGGGCNLEYVKKVANRVSSVVCLEPNQYLHSTINEKAKSLGFDNVEIYPRFADALIKERGGGLFDTIIVGNVFCEVPNQKKTVRELFKLLKPNGNMFFVEHVCHEQGTFENKLENAINPIWNTMSDGCNINRETLKVIERSAPWTQVCAWELLLSSPLVNRIHIGFAQK